MQNGGPDAVGRGQDVTEVEERGKRGREGGREGGGSYSDVKSGGAPSPRPYPKGPDRLNRRRISLHHLYILSNLVVSLRPVQTGCCISKRITSSTAVITTLFNSSDTLMAWKCWPDCLVFHLMLNA